MMEDKKASYLVSFVVVLQRKEEECTAEILSSPILDDRAVHHTRFKPFDMVDLGLPDDLAQSFEQG